MSLLRYQPYAFITLLLCLAVAPVYAATVYKTVDKEGNITYSDQVPDPEGLVIEQLNLPDYPEQINNSNQQLDQISKVANRLKQDRLEREELKLKQQQARQAALAPIYPQTIIEENHYHHYPRHLRRFRDFPSIYNPPQNQNSLNKPHDRNPNRGGLLTPKSKLLTP